MISRLAVIPFIILLLLAASSCERGSAAERGERAFHRLGCYACHTRGPGPDLAQVVRRQDPAFLEKFISNPPAVYEQRGMRPLNEGYTLMPDMHVSPGDARDLVAYLQQLGRQQKQK